MPPGEAAPSGSGGTCMWLPGLFGFLKIASRKVNKPQKVDLFITLSPSLTESTDQKLRICTWADPRKGKSKGPGQRPSSDFSSRPGSDFTKVRTQGSCKSLDPAPKPCLSPPSFSPSSGSAWPPEGLSPSQPQLGYPKLGNVLLGAGVLICSLVPPGPS